MNRPDIPFITEQITFVRNSFWYDSGNNLDSVSEGIQLEFGQVTSYAEIFRGQHHTPEDSLHSHIVRTSNSKSLFRVSYLFLGYFNLLYANICKFVPRNDVMKVGFG
jgi:hypothetical protein